MRQLLTALVLGVFTISPTLAQQQAPAGYFLLDTNVTLVTGETWRSEGQTYRLYGIQSCIRGTKFTNKSGEKVDCGDASLAVFSAYIKDTAPLCAVVTKINDTIFTSCYADIGGSRLDLANILVSQGYAFAAIDQQGLPIHPPYSASEQVASTTKKGLWAFDDVQHPSILLIAEKNKRQKQGQN